MSNFKYFISQKKEMTDISGGFFHEIPAGQLTT